MWSSDVYPAELDDANDDYMITISDANISITNHSSTSSLRVTLQFNTTYLITLYTSRCNQTLMSEPYFTNVTIDKGVD